MARAAHKETILVVDDSPNTLEVLQRNLESQGYRVYTASEVLEAVRLLEGMHVDLVITDLKMPGASGIELTRHVRANLENTEVIVITAYASIEGAVQALRSGAVDYLPKPFTDEELFSAVGQVLERLKLRRAAQAEARLPSAPRGFVGESHRMRTFFGELLHAAGTNGPVVVRGEPGSGRKLAAAAVHHGGRRGGGPLLYVNGALVPETAWDAMLFGGEGVAVPGMSPGLLVAASGGTLLIDGAEHMPPDTQTRLLAALPGGGLDGGTVVRGELRLGLILEPEVSGEHQGPLLKGLRDRPGVHWLQVPPLRERGDDVLLLANHFARHHCEASGRTAPRLTDDLIAVLREYPWPGNVTELENVMRKALAGARGELLDVHELPAHMRFTVVREATLNRTLSDVESDHIRRVLAAVNGNKTRAAQILGIDRKTLREKLKGPSGEGE